MTIPKHLMEAKLCNKDTCAEVEQLNSLVNSCQEEIRTLKEDIKVLLKENETKEKVIIKQNNVLKVMEKYFELIYNLGYDYDGLNNVDSLKKLIDEIIHYASLGRIGNTTEAIYENNNKKYNILNEELKESDK